ncbi:Sel1 repeat protein, partial [Snodgrassella alvi SCGC AB-598-O11]
GLMYLNGYGVKENNRMAKDFFGKSCKNGNQKACEIYNQI